MIAIEVGVISDTHGVLRDEAVAALQGVDIIIHAGDIGDPDLIERLGKIAPVNAIRGNVDVEPWADNYPDTLTIDILKQRFHIVHNIKTLDIDVVNNNVDVIICGHSHKPKIEYDQGRLILNPGSAGPRRFRLPVCIARLTVNSGMLSPRIIELV